MINGSGMIWRVRGFGGEKGEVVAVTTLHCHCV